jgi:hypothetical protein
MHRQRESQRKITWIRNEVNKKLPQRFSRAISPGEVAWRHRTQNPVTGSAFKDDLTCIQSDDHYRRALEDLERLVDNDF